jgi:xanthine dehydrogenase YagS FAD-binding subunit
MLRTFHYARPSTLDEAVGLLAKGNAAVHAGGSDLLGCMRDGILEPQTVVSLTGIDELVGIRRVGDGGFRIGARTTIAEIAGHTDIQDRFAALAEAAASVASPQLRNQGTIGGNLCQKPRCWYYRGDFHCLRKGGDICFAVDGDHRFHAAFGGYGCVMVHPSDTAPALAALGAGVEVAGPKSRRVVPLDEFHMRPEVDLTRETVLEPGEIVTAVILPPPASGLVSTYRKVRTRQSWDFAVAGVALALDMDGAMIREASVWLSGAAPVPWRARPAEAALRGRKIDDETVTRAADAAVSEADPLPGTAYKVSLFRGLVQERLESLRAALSV